MRGVTSAQPLRKGTRNHDNVKPAIDLTLPYVVEFKVEGICPMLFHAWNIEAIEEKANAARGSKVKKEDNLE